MSFDFMVFDPAIPAKTDEGFREWYEAEVSELAKTSSHDSALARNNAFRLWYAEMREMFTPFNGPDDVPLPDDASQARILRTCEYAFQPHSVFMSFRWGAADMARAAASTLAKQFDLGYYHVSAQYGQAVFPDGTKVWPSGKYPGFGAGKSLK